MTIHLDTTQTDAAVEPAVAHLLHGTGGAQAGPIPATTSASKGSNAYQVHTYPTKVPPAAIEPFILASTHPDAVILDPFCGSGMTGLAALATGRRAILSDLAPGAVHLAHNHTHPVDPETLASTMTSLTAAMAGLEAELYQSACPTCGRNETLRHMVWTDIHLCQQCLHPIRIWDGTDETGGSSRSLTCDQCGHTQSRSGIPAAGAEPAEKAVACASCSKLQRGPADADDLRLLARISTKTVPHWVPSVAMGPDREMYRRSALHLRGIKDVADFWNPRSKIALSSLWHHINTAVPEPARSALQFAFTNTAWHATRMRRFNALGGQRPLTGTLYIPQLVAEGNVFEIFRHQVVQLSRFYANHPADQGRPAAVARQSSATDLSWLPTGSIDYVFTDPPFGANLFYGDCNIVWEAWLGDVTDLTEEIVVNRSLPVSAGGKTMSDYQQLLTNAFCEVARVLKPEGRASVVFHNADDKVWSALLAAAEGAGLVQTDVSVLDKVQRSMKGYKGRSGAELVPFYDLVITFTVGSNPSGPRSAIADVALDRIRKHLAALPHGNDDRLAHQRTLEYLYSLAVGAVILSGQRPDGLSFKALQTLLREQLRNDGLYYYLDEPV